MSIYRSELEAKMKQECHGNDTLLFHYTSMDSACKILETNTLRLSNLVSVNDPLEFCLPEHFSFVGYGDAGDIKNVHQLQQSLKERRNSVRLLCFCRDYFCNQQEWNDKHAPDFANNYLYKGWARTRMWAQYANNHAGVCLIFDKEELRKAFLAENDKIQLYEDKPITYSNDFHELESIMTDISETLTKNSDLSHYCIEKRCMDTLFQKCTDFCGENEYRFLFLNTDLKSPNEEITLNYGQSLKAVMLGQRFTPSLKFALPTWIEQYKIHWNCGCPDFFKM